MQHGFYIKFNYLKSSCNKESVFKHSSMVFAMFLSVIKSTDVLECVCRMQWCFVTGVHRGEQRNGGAVSRGKTVCG